MRHEINQKGGNKCSNATMQQMMMTTSGNEKSNNVILFSDNIKKPLLEQVLVPYMASELAPNEKYSSVHQLTLFQSLSSS